MLIPQVHQASNLIVLVAITPRTLQLKAWLTGATQEATESRSNSSSVIALDKPTAEEEESFNGELDAHETAQGEGWMSGSVLALAQLLTGWAVLCPSTH